MEEIIIQDGSVCLRSVQELKRIRTEDFYRSLVSSLGVQTPLLPERTLFYGNNNDKRVYCIYRPPEQTVINVKDREGELREYNLKLPHLYFFHRFINSAFDELYVYCSREKVRNTTDMLCYIPLKNLFMDGHVCMGNDLKFGLEGSDAAKINMVEQHFFGSAFNSDLDGAYKEHAPDAWINHDPIEYWQQLSQQSDFDPTKVEWKKYHAWDEVIKKLMREK
jgi:hypothetical protein